MPTPRRHPWDEIPDNIVDYIEQEAEWTANELIGEYHAPFAAQINESEKLATYRRMFYMTDAEGNIDYNKPNTSQREALWNRVTPEQYKEIAKAVGPRGGIEHMQTLDAPDTASEEYRTPSAY